MSTFIIEAHFLHLCYSQFCVLNMIIGTESAADPKTKLLDTQCMSSKLHNYLPRMILPFIACGLLRYFGHIWTVLIPWIFIKGFFYLPRNLYDAFLYTINPSLPFIFPFSLLWCSNIIITLCSLGALENPDCIDYT